jgi:hypothetical protein
MRHLLYFLLFFAGLGGSAALGQDLVWVKQTGGLGQDGPWAQTIDGLGNTYTTGYFTDTCDFDPGPAILNFSPSNGLAFIRKLDPAGNLVWATQSGSPSGNPTAISIDASGNVYIAGNFSFAADFDPGTGVPILTPFGSTDIYVVKVDPLGNFLWTKQIGGTGPENPRSIAVDANGDLFVAGYISGTCDMDPGSGVYNLVSVGSADAFIAKYTSSGNFIWAKRFGGNAIEQVLSLTIDGSGNIYSAGYFQGTIDIDPGVGTQTMISAGGNDIFVTKWD